MKTNQKTKNLTLQITLTAMFMAMNIAASSYGVPVPGGHLYINDIIICTAAIIMNPLSAFMVGGVGAFIGDMLFYPAPMFVSLVTHGLQAVIISVFSHYILKKHPIASSGIGVTLGAIINIVGYSIGRAFIYGTAPSIAVAVMKLPYQIAQAAAGAIIGMLLVWKFGVYKLYNKTLQGKTV